MEDDLKKLIRSARKQPEDQEESRDSGINMPGIRHTSFDYSSVQKCDASGDHAPKAFREFSWAEKALRKHGSKTDRTLMAVRDAARICCAKGKDVSSEPFYVSPVIARGWNLNVRQLSEGLKELEKKKLITLALVRKGRHTRVLLKYPL